MYGFHRDFNDFRNLLPEIIEIHQSLDFPISHLPLWQQDILLKAIHIQPKLRFQSMADFAEAIEAKQVPFVFKKEKLDAGILAEKIRRLISTLSYSGVSIKGYMSARDFSWLPDLVDEKAHHLA